MTKIVNVKTTTETKVTTETTELVPAYFIEINPHQDFGAEDYYKSMGYEVKTMVKFGKKRIYAIIPVEGYAEATDEEKVILTDAANSFTQKVDNMRRKASRKNTAILEHENTSLEDLLEAGYDPSLDSIDVAIKISKKSDGTNAEESETTDNIAIRNGVDDDSNAVDYKRKKHVSQGAYNPLTDENNPEYILSKNTLYKKIHEMISELEGEELEIVTAIMNGVSQRHFSEDHNIARTTLQNHWNKLMKKCKEKLKDYYI